MNKQRIKDSLILQNPENPRSITEENQAKLVTSLIEFPEMLFMRPIVIGSNGVSLGGNMRLSGIKEIRAFTQQHKIEILEEQREKRKATSQTPIQEQEFEEAINHLLFDDDLVVYDVSFLSKEKQDEFIVKDNIAYGTWDWSSLDSLWGKETVEGWGLEVPKWVDTKQEKNQEKEVSPDDLETEHTCPKCGFEYND